MDYVGLYEEGVTDGVGRIKITPKDIDERDWLGTSDYICTNIIREYATRVTSNYYENIRIVNRLTYDILKKKGELEENVVYVVTEY